MFEDRSRDAPTLPFWFRMARAGPHENFHYLLGAEDSEEAIIVDPAFELESVMDLAKDAGRTVTGALFTHGHWDHIGGADMLHDYGVTRAAVHDKALHHPKLKDAAKQGVDVQGIQDGTRLGWAGLRIEALHTPGHQPESTCFLVGGPGDAKALFTGDTLFVGSCGRTDFPGGNTDHMFASMARLRNLAGTPGIHVFPGHDYHAKATRPLSQEVAENAALATLERDAFDGLRFLRG